MRYQEISSGNSYPYPNPDIDPKDKGERFCMQYAKAAWHDWNYVGAKGIFSANGGDYQKYRMYSLGKQPIDQYKKWMGVDAATNQTQLVVDWKVRSIVSGYRDKAIARLMKTDYGVVATPIDMEAKSEMDKMYIALKAKLAVRQMVIQQQPELTTHPLIAVQSGEPLDIEELEMRMNLGEQFNRSEDAEMAINLGFYENDYRTKRRRIYEDLFDCGVAGFKDWLGEDNKAKFRVVDPENVITSVSKDGTFKDIVHAGEIIPVSLIDLALLKDDEGNTLFTDDELQDFAGSIAGKYGNPTTIGGATGYLKPWDKFKCNVLDLEFFTYDTSVYRVAKDENGNEDFRKADYGRGKKSDKYSRKKIKYVYKCKWIIGTDKCYDFGKAYDQKRAVDPKKKAETKLSYIFYAYNFYDMRAQGFMERLVPYLDDYQLTMLKIQNFKNRAVPSGWWIDLSALESVAMNKGGKNMEPRELLQMFFETGVLLGRSEEEGGLPRSQNWKPVIPIENTAASELAMFYQDLISTITAIEKMTGYNDVTMGNASSKTLVPGYQTAQESTNESLAALSFAERELTKQLAENVFCRMQQGIKKGGVSGYAPALNNNLLQFVKLSPDLSLRDYGIELDEESSDDEKMWLMQTMNIDVQNGLLSSADAVTLVNTKNTKQAQAIWAFKTKRAKEQMQQDKMNQLQSTNQANLQSAQIAQQTAMQTLQMQGQIELQKKQMEVQGELQKEQMRIQSQERIAMSQNYAKLQVAETTGTAKVQSTDLAGQHSLTKQVIANQKPANSSN